MKEDGEAKDDDEIMVKNINIENLKDKDLHSLKSNIEAKINKLKKQIQLTDIP